MTRTKRLSASELLDFVANRMRMTSYYQPVIVAELVKADKQELPRDELAKSLLLADSPTVDRAVRVLMRWPKKTLERHGITRYDRTTKKFTLLADLRSEADRRAILEACDRRLAEWNRIDAPQLASARYAAIEAAGGRCQACGVLGSERPLDIDHVVPHSRSTHGRVEHPRLGWVAVHSVDNLQVLCSKCNRGKRDAGAYDFRPSEDRLIESIRIALDVADRCGLDRTAIVGRATSSDR